MINIHNIPEVAGFDSHLCLTVVLATGNLRTDSTEDCTRRKSLGLGLKKSPGQPGKFSFPLRPSVGLRRTSSPPPFAFAQQRRFYSYIVAPYYFVHLLVVSIVPLSRLSLTPLFPHTLETFNMATALALGFGIAAAAFFV